MCHLFPSLCRIIKGGMQHNKELNPLLRSVSHRPMYIFMHISAEQWVESPVLGAHGLVSDDTLSCVYDCPSFYTEHEFKVDCKFPEGGSLVFFFFFLLYPQQLGEGWPYRWCLISIC